MGSDVLTSASGCWLAAGGAAPRPGLRVTPRRAPCVEPPASPPPSSVRVLLAQGQWGTDGGLALTVPVSYSPGHVHTGAPHRPSRVGVGDGEQPFTHREPTRPQDLLGSDLILPLWAVRPCLGVAVSPSPPPLLPSHEVDDVSLLKLCLVGPHPSEWG